MVVLYMPIDQENLIVDKQLVSLISDSRQEALSVSQNQNHNINSIYAELLLKYGLRKYFGITGSLSFYKYEGGKPFLQNYPNIDFNLSHTKNMVMCGITENGKIGVDVEHIRTIHKNVADKVYSDFEIQYINEIPELKENRFFEIWTKKEAYTKYIGTGLRNNIKDINMLASIHTDKILNWNEGTYYFSVYSDYAISFPVKITVEELYSYLL